MNLGILLGLSKHTAGKQYRCLACEKVIEAGTEYYRERYNPFCSPLCGRKHLGAVLSDIEVEDVLDVYEVGSFYLVVYRCNGRFKVHCATGGETDRLTINDREYYRNELRVTDPSLIPGQNVFIDNYRERLEFTLP